MKLRFFIISIILIIVLLNGCIKTKQAFETELKEEPTEISDVEEASKGSEDVVEGLDEISGDLDELEEIVK